MFCHITSCPICVCHITHCPICVYRIAHCSICVLSYYSLSHLCLPYCSLFNLCFAILPIVPFVFCHIAHCPICILPHYSLLSHLCLISLRIVSVVSSPYYSFCTYGRRRGCVWDPASTELLKCPVVGSSIAYNRAWYSQVTS